MKRVSELSYNLIIQYNNANISGLIRLIYNVYTIVDIENDLSIMSCEDLINYIENHYHCGAQGACVHLDINMFMCYYCVIDIINQGIEDCELILYYKE